MRCVYVEMIRSDRFEVKQTASEAGTASGQVVPGSLLHQTFLGTLHSDHFLGKK